MSLMVSLVAFFVAATLAAAYPTKDEEAYYYNRLHDLPEYRQEVRNLDGIGGGNLLRDLDMLRTRAALLSHVSPPRAEDPRRYHYTLQGQGQVGEAGKRSAACCDTLSGIGIGTEKRNMDEIDRSMFNSFIKKNFDEIDRSGFGSFVKKNFDEIDRSGFGSFVKRSAPQGAAAPDQHPHN